MAKRNQIQALVNKVNEGGESAGYATNQIQQCYQSECTELYKNMMKSLSTIKAYKLEIDNFNKSGLSSKVIAAKKGPILPFQSLAAEENIPIGSCFACVQKLLLACLNLVSVTSTNSDEIKS